MGSKLKLVDSTVTNSIVINTGMQPITESAIKVELPDDGIGEDNYDLCNEIKIEKDIKLSNQMLAQLCSTEVFNYLLDQTNIKTEPNEDAYFSMLYKDTALPNTESNNSESVLTQTNIVGDFQQSIIHGVRSDRQDRCRQRLLTVDESSLYYVTSVDSYTNCIIRFNSRTSQYNCSNCSFFTGYIKDAVLHFVNNASEENNTNILNFNVENSLFECCTCDFTTSKDRNALDHWRKHLCRIPLKCFMCSFTTKEDSQLKVHLINHLNKKGSVKDNQIAKTNSRNGNKNTETFCCLKCDSVSKTLDHFSLHYYKAHGCKRFACAVCNIQFYYPSNLKQHVNETHTHTNFYKCLHCGSVLKHRNSFRVHLRAHMIEMRTESFDDRTKIMQMLAIASSVNHDKSVRWNVGFTDTYGLKTQDAKWTSKCGEVVVHSNMYRCSYCAFSCVLKKHLKEHCKEYHFDKRTYLICKYCKASFATNRTLKHHISYIHKRKYMECFHCSFRTKYKYSLMLHMEYHIETLSQLCYICGFQCASECAMNLHITRHISTKNISCNLCNFQCYTQSRLSLHLNIHSTVKRYACNLCDYRTNKVKHLTRHKQTHFPVEPLKCFICHYSCLSKSTLIEHVQIHLVTQELFRCSQCGKEYFKMSSFKRHQATHIDIEPYRCMLCSISVKNKSGLERHMKRHTGIGLMYCFECNYSSFHKGNFEMHVNKTCAKAKHANENQRHCYHCDYASSHRSNFINHVNKAHYKLKRKLLR